jgi:hypothetical protein
LRQPPDHALRFPGGIARGMPIFTRADAMAEAAFTRQPDWWTMATG